MTSLTSLTPLPYPDPTDQPFVHLDLQALAEATAEALPVADTAYPPHRPGRIFVHTGLGVTLISDGLTWRPLGVHVMADAFDDESGTLPTGTYTPVLNIAGTLVAGPAVLRATGIAVNANSGAPRFAELMVDLDGTQQARTERLYLMNEASNNPGVPFTFAIPFTATGGAHTARLMGGASLASAVTVRNARLWIEQGGRAAGVV